MKRKSKVNKKKDSFFFHFEIDYWSIYLAITKGLLVTSNPRRSHLSAYPYGYQYITRAFVCYNTAIRIENLKNGLNKIIRISMLYTFLYFPGIVVQLVRAPPCQGGSCGFEPRQSRRIQLKKYINRSLRFLSKGI